MKVRAGYKQTEVGVIPEDWQIRSLGEVGDVKMCKRIFKNQTQVTGDIPFYKIGTFGSSPNAFISEALFNEYKSKFSFPKKGDVLISAAGTIGRTVIYDGSPAYFQDSNIIWIDNDQTKVSNEYISHFYKIIKWSVSHGGVVARLYNANIKRIQVYFPNHLEQCAIATALSDVNELLATQERLLIKKRDIKKAVMQQLLSGKKRLQGFTDEWQVRYLGDIAVVLKGRGLSKDKVSRSGSKKCVLYGELFTTYSRVITDVVSSTDSCEGTLSINGDVLLPGSTTTTGIDLATASVLLFNNVLLGGDINIVRAKGDFYSSTFLAYLLTEEMKHKIAEMAQGTTIIHLYGKSLLKLELCLPTIKEQIAIATILSDIDEELTNLEKQRDKTSAIKQGMIQELLTGSIRLV
jgi:type I restriction enzyme S subunit